MKLYPIWELHISLDIIEFSYLISSRTLILANTRPSSFLPRLRPIKTLAMETSTGLKGWFLIVSDERIFCISWYNLEYSSLMNS